MQKELSKTQAIEKLWKMGNLEWKLKGVQKEMRQAVNNSIGKKTVFLVSRRLGKCLAKNTQVITTEGMKNIQDINPGDYVYGWNKDGSISPSKVLAMVDQGVKEVVELTNRGKVIAECTLDHPWLAYNTTTKKVGEYTTREILDRSNLVIKREFIKSPCGNVNEPHAYALGVLLGDGCSKEGVNAIHLSSEDDVLPRNVANILDCKYYKQKSNNYTWVLSYNDKLKERSIFSKDHIYEKPNCNYYLEWCHDRYAYEKIIDLEVIKKWDRESCLNLLAGLIDSDGSVFYKENRLKISFLSQSYSLVKAFRFLFYQLFQVELNIYEDKRSKYKNGNVFFVTCASNLYSKIALKELSDYIKLDKKKWKHEYSDLPENNSNPEFIGVKRGKTRTIQTYDLSIDNETKLYMLANGTITHNTFVMMTLAVEHCIKNPNSIVKVLFPKKKDAKAVARDQMKVILDDCPKDLMPDWKEADKLFLFPNGSEIQMAGTDGGSAESVRGSRCHLAILDEAGFHDYNEFSYIIQSIIMPTLLTTKGKMILASTPSKEPDHPFMVDYVLPARRENTLIEYTIYDNPLIDKNMIDEISDEFPGGKDDPDFLREFMLKSDIASNDFVIPEFTQDVQKDVIQEVPIPIHIDVYVSGDPAVIDLTHILFAYYDFLNNRIVIEDELVLGGEGEHITTQEIADGIRRKEKLRFTNSLTGETQKPYLRVMDNNNKILINDLIIEHGLDFIPTAKDQKEAQINKLRMMIRQGKIIIHPRCKNLIHHIKNARWDKNRKGFQRIKVSRELGLKANHCDGVDALIYLVRNVDMNRNPYPYDFFQEKGWDYFNSNPENGKNQQYQDVANAIFNKKFNK